MKNQVAIVTGAGAGIGRSVAQRLAKDGFHVVVNDINLYAAEEVAKEIESLGGKSLAIQADVSKKSDVFEMVSKTVKSLGRLDVMVSNAGIAQVNPIIDVSEEDIEKVFRINTFGVIYCLQAAAEQMIKQGGGKIINASSAAGKKGSAFLSHYSASKFAVVGITQSAAQELAAYGITVNAYCPGIVGTDMWELVDEELGKHLHLEKGKAMERSIGKSALNRVETPEDVAGVVSFLASKDADFMTGQSVVVDGGMVFP